MMGVKGKRGTIKKYTERDIQNILFPYFFSPNSLKYYMFNLEVYDWESDVLMITKSDIVYEFEIKISRADFKNDFKHKTEKHNILRENHEGYTAEEYRPNYFYYAVPENLITIEEVPEYAGLIYITDVYPYFKTIKPAPKLHSQKIDYERYRMMDKFFWNYISWREKAENEYRNTIESLREQISEAKTDENGQRFKYNIAEANKKIKEQEGIIHIKEQYIDKLNEQLKEEIDERHRIYRLLKKNDIILADLEKENGEI